MIHKFKRKPKIPLYLEPLYLYCTVPQKFNNVVINLADICLVLYLRSNF